MGKVGWSDLPEELVNLIADRVSSHIDLLRSRSICKPWRSAVATKKRFPYRFERNLPSFKKKKTLLSPTSFFRVTIPSSCPNKGWLIKTRQVSESGKSNFLSPLCGKLITPSDQTLDLLKLGVSEIRQSYNVQHLREIVIRRYRRAGDIRISYQCFASRVVLVENMLFAVGHDEEIWYCKIGEESSEWSIIKSEEAKCFSDIIVQKGLIYALDLKGGTWWISLPELKIYQYRPSTPLDDDYYGDDYCKDKRIVEYCGDLCVVHRFCKKFRVKGAVIERTVGFKVYKMDANLVEWVHVTSLGDKALIVCTDSCFTVSASEYYGCLKNAIYYTDKVKGEDIVHVFKLDDSSIISMNDSSSHSCFELFSHPFL